MADLRDTHVAANPTAATGWQATTVWLVGQTSPQTQRRGRFVAGSGAHPARMLPHLAAHAIDFYTRPGDLVFDPLAGIGTTLVEAVHAGRDAIGVELEPGWAALAKANVALARRQGGTGVGRVITADATHLPAALTRELHGRVSLVLTSPPYGRTSHGRVEHRHGPLTRFANTYGPTDPANLAHRGRTCLLAGITDVLRQCIPLLTPSGVIVMPVNPWRRDGLLVDLPGQVLTCAQDVGLRLHETCIAVHAAYRDGRFQARHSFWQLSVIRQQRRNGIPQHLPVHEQVLVLRTGGDHR